MSYVLTKTRNLPGGMFLKFLRNNGSIIIYALGTVSLIIAAIYSYGVLDNQDALTIMNFLLVSFAPVSLILALFLVPHLFDNYSKRDSQGSRLEYLLFGMNQSLAWLRLRRFVGMPLICVGIMILITFPFKDTTDVGHVRFNIDGSIVSEGEIVSIGALSIKSIQFPLSIDGSSTVRASVDGVDTKTRIMYSVVLDPDEVIAKGFTAGSHEYFLGTIHTKAFFERVVEVDYGLDDFIATSVSNGVKRTYDSPAPLTNEEVAYNTALVMAERRDRLDPVFKSEHAITIRDLKIIHHSIE